MTITAINALKSKDIPIPKRKKPNNELLRMEIPYAALDTRRVQENECTLTYMTNWYKECA